MKTVHANKIVIKAFEKVGLELQYGYKEGNNIEEISLSVEIFEEDIKNITFTDIVDMCNYIHSETDSNSVILMDFKEILGLLDNNQPLFLVWE